ncbi:MAG TPA: SRPBCC family protein [Kofleriaceae bacterium]|nr:SRPBCC family protein [Kofleriaceae bacterium]
MTTTTTDGIRKQITLRAAPARVWRALSSAKEFGTWFGVELRDEFAPGATVRGTVHYQGKELPLTFHIERMEAERLMSFRWHPYAVDPAIDYSSEPMTLVELTIAPAAEGTLLTVTETGFDQIPIARRAKAFEMNSGGWAAQLENIARHVHA